MILINGHHKGKKNEIILLFVKTLLFLLLTFCFSSFFFLSKSTFKSPQIHIRTKEFGLFTRLSQNGSFFPVNQLFDYGFLFKWKLFLFFSLFFSALLDRKTFSAIGKDFEIIIWLLMRKLKRREEIFIPQNL